MAARKKTTVKKRQRPKRVMMAVDLFVQKRRQSYERATELAGLREMSEWIRRVLDAEAKRAIAEDLQATENAIEEIRRGPAVAPASRQPADEMKNRPIRAIDLSEDE